MTLSSALWLLLICLLTVYAPIELSRGIIYGITHNLYPIPDYLFIGEMAVFWVMYIGGLIVVYKVMK